MTECPQQRMVQKSIRELGALIGMVLFSGYKVYKRLKGV